MVWTGASKGEDEVSVAVRTLETLEIRSRGGICVVNAISCALCNPTLGQVRKITHTNKHISL